MPNSYLGIGEKSTECPEVVTCISAASGCQMKGNTCVNPSRLPTRQLRNKEVRNSYWKHLSDVASGRKLFGIILGDLVDKFLDYRWKDVENGTITEARFNTIQSQCRALLRTKPRSVKIAELDENSFHEWRQIQLKKSTRELSLIQVCAMVSAKFYAY